MFHLDDVEVGGTPTKNEVFLSGDVPPDLKRVFEVNGADQLTTRIEEGLTMAGADEIAAPFLPALTSSPAGRDRGVQAVLLYGSVLWKATRDKTSQPDFIVVVDSLSAWYRRFRD